MKEENVYQSDVKEFIDRIIGLSVEFNIVQ
jgi:hypothetical protein